MSPNRYALAASSYGTRRVAEAYCFGRQPRRHPSVTQGDGFWGERRCGCFQKSSIVIALLFSRSEGLEPPAYRFEACCSIQLSYDRASVEECYVLPFSSFDCARFARSAQDDIGGYKSRRVAGRSTRPRSSSRARSDWKTPIRRVAKPWALPARWRRQIR